MSEFEFGLPPGSLKLAFTPQPIRALAMTMGLVQTPKKPQQSSRRTRALKPSSNSRLPIAWIKAPATDANINVHVNESFFENENRHFHIWIFVSGQNDSKNLIFFITQFVQVTTGRQKGLLLAAEDCRRVPMCNVNPGFELWQYQFEVVPDLNRKTKRNW